MIAALATPERCWSARLPRRRAHLRGFLLTRLRDEQGRCFDRIRTAARA
jgi:hypothetical protein